MLRGDLHFSEKISGRNLDIFLLIGRDQDCKTPAEAIWKTKEEDVRISTILEYTHISYQKSKKNHKIIKRRLRKKHKIVQEAASTGLLNLRPTRKAFRNSSGSRVCRFAL